MVGRASRYLDEAVIEIEIPELQSFLITLNDEFVRGGDEEDEDEEEEVSLTVINGSIDVGD